ncbi:MAG: HAD family phosphatase [Planctomycetales bacterium]|nr:HAD family phosphatase [Planctomycetales bacterium]
MSSIRFIYFDLGNVLLNFDHGIACARIAAGGSRSEQEVDQLIFGSGLQNRFESGEIAGDRFAQQVAVDTGWQAEPSELLEICSDIFDLNAAIVPVVAHLKAAQHRLGILSNTCSAHWDWVYGGRYSILRGTFEQLVLSYEVGAMKPARSIYDAAIAAAGVPAEAIFFTDDREENVAGALAAGIDATLFRGTQALIDDLRARGIRCNI